MRSLTRWGVVVAALVAVLGYSNPAQALHSPAAVLTANGCTSAKIKCVIKKKACLLGLYKKSFAPAQTAIDKCKDKFDLNPAVPLKGCFTKLDQKVGNTCITKGDAAVMEAKVDAHVKDLLAEMNPTGFAGVNKCQNAKVGCVLKYNSCVLGLFSKAAKAGGPIDVTKLPKCTDGLTKCITKLDIKYGEVCVGGTQDGETCVSPLGTIPPGAAQLCADGKLCVGGANDGEICTVNSECPGGGCAGGVCTAQATPCLTTGDLIALRNKDDAFIDDVVAELQTVGAPAPTAPDMNTKRCSGNLSVTCSTTVPDCNVAGGTCDFYFGSPLPLAAGGVATCVVNKWNGGISGTFNQQTGHSAGTASVIATVYNGIDIHQPCPRCVNDMFPNDGAGAGTCSGGARNGLGCDSNGESPEPTFGDTSLDCPPSSVIAALPVDLTNTTGTNTMTLTALSPNCNAPAALGKKCMCGSCSESSTKPCRSNADCTGTCTNAAGAGRAPSACVDDTSTGTDESLCLPTTIPGEGECQLLPVDQRCHIQKFRSCTLDIHCKPPVPGTLADSSDTCDTLKTACFPGYDGVVNNTITAIGSSSGPRNHAGVQVFASTFCVAPTGLPAVDNAAGLPGPGRLALGGVGYENGTGVGGACPTLAGFLPTFKGGVLDTGWTGVAHNAKVVGQGKVTVGVTGCSLALPDANGNCGICSYTGPIPNPNALP